MDDYETIYLIMVIISDSQQPKTPAWLLINHLWGVKWKFDIPEW